ncbi:MAG TPA: type I-C CRISPR-associated protein Cas8c/Csd1 [Bacillus sp. (in: Bacteria)]|uniref:CRISPR-associated protein Csd1 n=1 Tax=Anoxybacillus andreesenii TaxID=1325932 RepID=A0ABT9V9C8_9BACL|nr:type I-C CRISPR-associated protein Cas8c/Csd1 [Robertmurraya andreesenii]MDQ0157556.1 CRISPR-associated protein Csd1 [Robertmurraya andreesenii]HCX48642.1 type I-C CRISPR-associated protein Cas8c/Csd1 [Bacillus sp. (in: firmicutes)]
MILNSLVDYYQVLSKQKNNNIPKQGYSEEKVHFCLVIDTDGNLKSVRDLRELSTNKKNSKLLPTKLTLPERVQKSSGITSNFLWENSEYLLGLEKKKEKGNKKKKELTLKRFHYFSEFHKNLLSNIDDVGAQAFLHFLEKHNSNGCQHPIIEKMEDEMNNGEMFVIRLEGDAGYLHERPALITAWENHYFRNEGSTYGVSLLSGKEGVISEGHATIKGVRNAQSSGARIVSFNSSAFESYGHKKGFISPITEEEMFQYTTALNYLLERRNQCIQIGDATTVFWSKSNSLDQTEIIYNLFSGGDLGQNTTEKIELTENQHETNKIRSFLRGVQRGNKVIWDEHSIEPETEFYILGLSPNNARISIRYFYRTNFGTLIENIAKHFKDVDIFTNYSYTASLTPWRMLNETSVNDKTHPLLGGSLFKALVTGGSYPNMLYQQILSRIRAGEEVNYYKAACIKGYLLRKARMESNKKMEGLITVSLNEKREDFAYLFGRLFAVMENIQVAAYRDTEGKSGIERTIKNTYFSRASTTPKVVFSTLIRLNQHHQDKLAKEKKGLQVKLDKLITEIVGNISNVPAQLNYEEQGEFMLGYYQQKQELYRKGDSENGESN